MVTLPKARTTEGELERGLGNDKDLPLHRTHVQFLAPPRLTTADLHGYLHTRGAQKSTQAHMHAHKL